MFIAAARFPKQDFDADEAIRNKADEVEKHLKELALDVGLDPDRNVKRSVENDEVRIGVSEQMDEYLREAPGSWRFY